jgi:hypothetical protein
MSAADADDDNSGNTVSVNVGRARVIDSDALDHEPTEAGVADFFARTEAV